MHPLFRFSPTPLARLAAVAVVPALLAGLGCNCPYNHATAHARPGRSMKTATANNAVRHGDEIVRAGADAVRSDSDSEESAAGSKSTSGQVRTASASTASDE